MACGRSSSAACSRSPSSDRVAPASSGISGRGALVAIAEPVPSPGLDLLMPVVPAQEVAGNRPHPGDGRGVVVAAIAVDTADHLRERLGKKVAATSSSETRHAEPAEDLGRQLAIQSLERGHFRTRTERAAGAGRSERSSRSSPRSPSAASTSRCDITIVLGRLSRSVRSGRRPSGSSPCIRVRRRW